MARALLTWPCDTAELDRAFRHWAKVVEEAKELREKMQRAVNRFVMAELDRSFHRWAEAVAQVGRCRLTVLKPVLKAPMVSALDATIW